MKLLFTLTLLLTLSLSVDVWKSFVDENGLELDVSQLKTEGLELVREWKSQYGGNGGGPFSDDCEAQGGLAQIRVECGRYVGQIALKCKSGGFKSARGLGWGNGAASRDIKHTFDASAITKIEIRAGSYVDKVIFYAGNTKKFTCGGSNGGTLYRVTAPAGMVLCAMRGRAGWWMDKLGAGFCWADRDCQVSGWTCGACAKATGKQTCNRSVTVTQRANGKRCPGLSEVRNCKVDCEQSEFSCGSCAKATGQKSCQRSTKVSAKNGGKACGPSSENRNCPVACEQGAWACSSCDAASGLKSCQRPTLVGAKNGGTACGDSTKKDKCPVDCAQAGWVCGVCDKNKGSKGCQRATMVTAKNGGKACGPSSKTDKCPVDCEQGAWGCGSCNKGTGKKICERKTMITAKNGGKACAASTKDDPCPVNCEQTPFSCGACNKGSGLKACSRKTTVTAKNGGTACGGLTKNEKCPVDCEQSPFECDAKRCNKSTGQCPCSRRTTVTAKNGGKACGGLSKTAPCKVNCEQSAWSCDSNKCNKANGLMPCSRRTTVTAKNGGTACGGLSKNAACKVNCEQSGWSCGACDKKTGTKKCTRKTTVTAKNGGTACGALSKTEKCPVNCEVGAFGGWGSCNKECGGGKSTRSRKVTVKALNGGKACPGLSESRNCNTMTCVKCPAGSSRWGPYNADYPGRGLVGHKYNLSTAQCMELCRARSDCGAIHYFAKGGHPGIAKTVCELYPTSVKSLPQKYGTNSVVCKVPQLKCPSGSSQFYGINADLGGRGLVGHLYNLSITQCQAKCNSNSKCESFHWFPKNGHPGIPRTVCELYPINGKPTGKYGTNSIVCKRCCANFYQHCNYRGWKRRECSDNTWIGRSHNDNLSAVQVDAGCKVTLYEHAHYKGKAFPVKGNISCLVNRSYAGIRNWNDIVSSWRIGRGLSFRFSQMTEEEMAMAEAQFVDEFDEEESFIANNAVVGFGAVVLVGVGAYFYKRRQGSDYEELIDV